MEYIKDSATIQAAQLGDEEALSRIVESNMGLVKHAARRFTDRGTDLEDLIQIGAMGLVKAIRRFDTQSGLSLTTYAVPMIVGEIRRFLRDDGLVKISRNAKTNYAKIGAFCADYRNRFAKDPSLATIAQETRIPLEDVVYAMEANQPTISLFEQKEDKEGSPLDFLGDDSMEEHLETLALRELITRLPPQEEQLIYFRYYRQLTQSQTAKLLGMTQVMVSRKEKKICEKLRKELLA